MLRVTGLDVSATSTGVALPSGTLSTIRPKGKAEDPYRRLHELVLAVVDLLRGEPDLVVVEGYSLGSVGALAGVRLAEAGGAVRLALWEAEVPFLEVRPATLKKYATNRGNATKPEVLAAARREVAAVRNGDEGDAYWLRRIGVDLEVADSDRYRDVPPWRRKLLAGIDGADAVLLAARERLVERLAS